MKKYAAMALAAIATLAIAACGEITTTKTVTVNTKQNASAPKPTSKDPQDSDSDGVADDADFAPNDPSIQFKSQTDSDGDGTTDGDDYAPHDAKIQTKADSEDCDVLGINDGKTEGSCIQSGTKYKVVNRATSLRLKQMSVTLNSITQTDTIPVDYDNPLVGSFVVADVSITNNLNAPVNVDGTDMFALRLGKKMFTPDSDAMISAQGLDDNIIFDDVQPGQAAHGKVVFRVPARSASKLATDGNFLSFQFSDADNGATPQHRVGIIRTYH